MFGHPIHLNNMQELNISSSTKKCLNVRKRYNLEGFSYMIRIWTLDVRTLEETKLSQNGIC